MTKNYSIKISNGITEIRFTKVAKLSCICDAMDEVIEKYLTNFRLWDISNGIDLNSSEAQKVGEYAKSKFLTPGWSAIIAPTDLSYGTARMEDVYREDNLVTQKVFRSEQEALDWLNSQPSDTENTET